MASGTGRGVAGKGGAGSSGVASGEGLARVTYLPGVMRPAPDSTPTALKPAAESTLPTMDSVFGVGTVPETSAPRTSVPEAWLAPNTDTGPEGADAAAKAETPEDLRYRAERASMQSLTRRGMSRWELGKALLARDLDEETVEYELDRLEGVGLIDDAALAETLVRTQHERKGLGRSALTAELRRRHIDPVQIDEALAQVGDDDEQSRATELAVKRAPQLRSLDSETAKRRLSGFLMRKGYSGSVVRAAVDEALSGHSGRANSGGVRFR
ncbi:MAG: regulatory protein [Microbacteriaceae bacterium]|nr:regulatory protein [Microbacteriaceae bacterium]